MKVNSMVRWLVIGAAVLAWSGVSAATAADAKRPGKPEVKATAKQPPRPKPTLADVAYGPHRKQVLNFYKVDSPTPTPLMFYIHGGSWMAGDRDLVDLWLLNAGISVVSIEYRFVSEAQAAGVKPPVSWALHDAARALQFVRSKAGQWNIDKTRIGAMGCSAGACSSLWLAFHDDMADPRSADPVARESTRLTCAAVIAAQTTLDPKEMKEWTPNSNYGGHAFGFAGNPAKGLSPFQEFLEQRETILPWIKEYSPFALATADDPPVFLLYTAPPALGKPAKDPTHSANFGLKLQEKLHSVGVECCLAYPGASGLKYRGLNEFMIAKLKEPPGYDDTPRLPNSRWRVHDRTRPQPPMLEAATLPGQPPADAIVLFNGKDLSQWEGGDAAGIENGCINILKTGQIVLQKHGSAVLFRNIWIRSLKLDN